MSPCTSEGRGGDDGVLLAVADHSTAGASVVDVYTLLTATALCQFAGVVTCRPRRRRPPLGLSSFVANNSALALALGVVDGNGVDDDVVRPPFRLSQAAVSSA